MTLTREYALRPQKNLYGMANAVQDFFKGHSRVDVRMVKISSSNYVVLCRTDSIIRKSTGFDMDVKVSFKQYGNKVTVDYSEKINNIIRTVKATAMSVFVLGIPQLFGAKERHELPGKVHNAIMAYLNGI